MKYHFKLAMLALLVSSITHASELHFVASVSPSQITNAELANDYLSQQLSRDHRLAYERHGVLGHYYSFYPLIDQLPLFSVVDALAVSKAGVPFRYFKASNSGLKALKWPESTLPPDVAAIAKASGIKPDNFEVTTIAKGWWQSEEYSLQPVWQVKLVQLKSEATLSFYLELTEQKLLSQERTVEAYQPDFTPQHLQSGHSLQALVFEPDPKTTLMAESLELQALTELLPDAAYSLVELQDLEAVDGGFMLSGPYVKVVDLVAPVNPSPVLSNDSEWRRHDEQFVQVMAYYHLDKAQRHLQRLGYQGPSQIFYGPIEVDARGGTSDQSAYSFRENRILLGIGGVPDGEDADVIWHEFGHGLLHFINNSDKGGDSGAIGEGFSDFYAGVHSFRDPQGQVFEPNVMFNWDARFGNRKPRTLNDQTAKYNPNYRYPAHQWVKDTLGDQLWSTPLFQGMRQAFVNHGEQAIDDFERLVIEAMYGMGAGIRMDQLALSTLDMAVRMYPNTDYGAILQRQFDHHGLILDPIELTNSGVIKQQRGAIDFNFAIQNLAVAKLEAVSFSFYDLPEGISVSGAMSPIAELLAGETKEVLGQFKLDLGTNLSCGQQLALPVDVRYTSDIAAINNSQLTLDVTIGEGKTHSVSGQGGDLLDATANDAGLTREKGVSNFHLDFSQLALKVKPNLTLALDIEHPQFDQLTIKLTSPSGQQITIWDRDYYPRKNFNYSLPNSLVDIDWSPIIGESLTGNWQLQIVDHDATKHGKLLSWGLSQISEYTCSQPDVSSKPDPTTIQKPSKSGGSLGWSLLMLSFAYLIRKKFNMEQ